jgi:hypothetical protein
MKFGTNTFQHISTADYCMINEHVSQITEDGSVEQFETQVNLNNVKIYMNGNIIQLTDSSGNILHTFNLGDFDVQDIQPENSHFEIYFENDVSDMSFYFYNYDDYDDFKESLGLNSE